MLAKKGITFVEMAVVVLIIAILAGATIPILRGRIDAVKWAEGKAMMGIIAASIRAYIVGQTQTLAGATRADLTYEMLNLSEGDFDGSYFNRDLFDWMVNYDASEETLFFTVTAQCPDSISFPVAYTLNHNGQWEMIASGP